MKCISSPSFKLIFSILVLQFCFGSIFAQWSDNPNVNNAICDEPLDQLYPKMVSDGSGGAIITWEDNRNGNTDANIYVQRINSLGFEQWTINGATICKLERNQWLPKLISDQNGGAIMCWQDFRDIDNSFDIYAQRINTDGAVQWATNGIVICNNSDYQYTPIIVGDGAGGAIICWGDFRDDGVPNANIYAQKINASGVTDWATNGVQVTSGPIEESDVSIVSDGLGGAIITWKAGAGTHIYTQRVSSTGVPQWTANGVDISDDNNSAYPIAIADGNGGAIITWVDKRNEPYYHVFAQKINANGDIAWAANGVAICAAEHSGTHPKLVSDGSGGAIITWEDLRDGFNIYAQKINSSGEVQWTTDGVAVCTAVGDQVVPVPTSDDSGGAIITWGDKRAGGTFGDIYAQKIDAMGDVQWTTNGIAISTANSDQNTPAIVSAGAAGAIISWGDKRSNTSSDIYAQGVNANGVLGDITAIPDEPDGKIGIALYQNNPNPVKQFTNIQYEINKSGLVILKVYDLLGNEMCTLVNEKNAAGKYEVGFDASNISPGIYIYKLQLGSYGLTRKMNIIN